MAIKTADALKYKTTGAKAKKNADEKEFEAAFDKNVNKTVIEEDPNKGMELGLILQNIWETQKVYRRPYEVRWLENLRQYRSLYDPTTSKKIRAGTSKVYPGITRAKVNMVLSRLNEMLYPDVDRSWQIEPSPVPQIPENVAKEIRRQMYTATGRIPTDKEFQAAIMEYAKATCIDMQKVMDDQLNEMNFSAKMGKPTLASGILYGHGLVKGPLVHKVKRNKWVATLRDIEAKSFERLTPYFEFVPVWVHYPDLSVTDPDDQDWQFQRHVKNKKQLMDLAKRDDFIASVIKEYVKENPSGNYTPETWETELRQLMLADIADSKDVFQTDETAIQTFQQNKYVLLECWGAIDGKKLRAAGMTDLDETLDDEQLEVNIWLLGGKIIKVAKNDIPGPEKKAPYHWFYYQKDESSIYGEGLPRAMRHSQLAISGAARMLLNNAAICSGPQIEVNYSLVTNEDIMAIYPMKIWTREGKGQDLAYPAVRVYNIDSHIPEYISIIEQFKKFGDEETTLPSWLIGANPQQTNETVGGTSMRLGAITISLKDVVRNFDDHTESVIDALYWWNMEFNDRADIKGDFNTCALGSSTLVMKEVRMQALNQLALSLTPEDWAYIPRRKFLEERIKANDIDLELRTEEEMSAFMQSQTDQRMKELSYKQVEAEIRKTEAMAMRFGTVAQKTKVEADNLLAGIVPGQEDSGEEKFDIEKAMTAEAKLREIAAKIQGILAKVDETKARTEAIKKGAKSGVGKKNEKK